MNKSGSTSERPHAMRESKGATATATDSSSDPAADSVEITLGWDTSRCMRATLKPPSSCSACATVVSPTSSPMTRCTAWARPP